MLTKNLSLFPGASEITDSRLVEENERERCTGRVVEAMGARYIFHHKKKFPPPADRVFSSRQKDKELLRLSEYTSAAQQDFGAHSPSFLPFFLLPFLLFGFVINSSNEQQFFLQPAGVALSCVSC